MTKSRDLGDLAQTVAVSLPTSLGTAGQALVVNSGADGLEFGAASGGGSGVTTYTGKSGTDGTPSGATYIDNVSSPSEGDLAYDLAADQLYIRTTSAWTRLALGFDESPIIITEPVTSHTLNSDGTTSTVTMLATDPEGFSITYGIAYPNASNSLPDQLATATSINQSTGVYTFDPSTTESHAGTVNVRLSASDGARITTRIVSLLLEFPKVWYGARAVFAGGRKTSPNDPTNGIEYIAIASSDSSTTTFGTLSMDASCSGCSDGTRGVFHLFHSSAPNTLEYVTISTTGNSTDFGDTSNTGENTSMCSNGTNGLHFNSGSSATQINIITINTTGNAASHANLSSSSQSGAALSDETRAVHAHGYSGGLSNTISYLPYTASASVSDFGNLALARQGLAGCSDTHRGIFAGGLNSSYRNEIDYLVIQTTGNATDYADLARTAFYLSAGSDATYAVFAGGYNDKVDRMTIQTQANATNMASLAFTKRLIGTACGG